MKSVLIILLFIVGINFNILAENGIKDSILSTSKGFILSPIKWGNQDIILIGYTLTGISTAYFFDEQIKELCLTNQNKDILNTGKYLFEPSGNIIPISLSAVFLGSGLLFKDKKLLKAGIGSSQALIGTSLLTTLFKNTFQRKRPFQTDLKSDFLGFNGHFNFNSFPSGHTGVAFASASFFSTYYHKTWIYILCYSLASLTAFSRVYGNQHWLSDVAFSSVIGTASGYYFAKKWKE